MHETHKRLARTLPPGAWVRRSPVGLRLSLLRSADYRVLELPSSDMYRILRRSELPARAHSLSEFEQLLTVLLTGAALRMTAFGATCFEGTGLRLARAIGERITREATPPRPKRNPLRMQWWKHCAAHLPPLPALEPLRPLLATSQWREVIWLNGKVAVWGASSAIQGAASLQETAQRELQQNLAFVPLLRLASEGVPAPDEQAEEQADEAFLLKLRRERHLVGTVAPYECISIEYLASPGAGGRSRGHDGEAPVGDCVRVLVDVPEHIAETSSLGTHVHWPRSTAGIQIPLDAETALPSGVLEYAFRFKVWGSELARHPVVSPRDLSVCIDNSAKIRAQQIATRGGDLGTSAAEQLLALREGIVYGVHSELPGAVHQPYHNMLPPARQQPPYPLLNTREAQSLAQRKGLEIVPWVR
jgi:hypothetical protein